MYGLPADGPPADWSLGRSRRLMIQARTATARVIPVSTIWLATWESDVSAASVPLVSPCNVSPSTGRIGAPHPATLHGEVNSPNVLRIAPANPPRPPPRHATPPPRRTPRA